MNDPIMFLRRDSDGLLWRGARYWKWTKSWRRASALQESFWNTFIVHKLRGQAFKLVTLDEIILAEREE